MKMGLRTPSYKKSFKAKTTGKVNRNTKKVITPGYGQKGMGVIKDPKRAMYNKAYNKTTVGINDINHNEKHSNYINDSPPSETGIGKIVAYVISTILMIVGIIFSYQGITGNLDIIAGLGKALLGLVMFIIGIVIALVTRKL
ncbi:hypothetical protein LQE92_08815 [Lacrimispora sp. NSJ-141]|uniref:Uncharacterized protein n=1 Tax=Lientehia hominis TaxID=2897778 RepID=A0AAP2RKZ5_9FIRM|nr:hypothetical protein [Lientehia hominis]MCD2492728.1 hypothetical protein [Lientehia hominis]